MATNVPGIEGSQSSTETPKRLMYCVLSGTSLTTVDTNSPRMANTAGQIKILRSGTYWVAGSWDFNLTGAVQDLQIRVNWVTKIQSYRANYYTQNDRFVQPIGRKLRLREGDVLTIAANVGSYNGSVTWLEAYEENQYLTW